jgi:peptidoglycan/xylan/chitin deacetylase (PgdA/CDA1 family)
VPLDEIVERSVSHKSTSGLFAITIDDGVGENVRALGQVFLQKRWPATFYLPTQYLDTGEGMPFQWWRQIQPLLPRRTIHLRSGTLDLHSAECVEDLSRKMERMWHTRRQDAYLPLLMELVEVTLKEARLPLAAVKPQAPISWPEVEELSKHELLRFESHGVTHAAMSSLTEEELCFEMKHSRDLLTERTGRRCRHMAYPFGSPESIGSLAASVARRFYDSAVTMTLGHVDEGDPWLLRRIPLYPKNSTWVARMKVFLKCWPPVFTERAAQAQTV